jgi:L-iditol 2-dehydrogenase
VRPDEAVFVEPVNTCLKAVVKAGVQKGETTFVVGQGPIGLLITQLLRWTGADVIVSDPLAERRALGRSLGATVVLGAGDDVPAEVQALTDGRGADCAFVAAVGPAALAQAIAATRAAGRIMSFAATSPGETAEVDLGAMTASEKDILTSYSASVDLQDQAAQLVFRREIRVRELVSHRLPFERALEAFGLARRPGAGTLKVVIERESGGR